MNLERVEKYRKHHPFLGSTKKGDDFGWFEIPTSPAGPVLRCQLSPGMNEFEFEHVSVSLANRCPSWAEMCRVKELFWDDEDVVVQFHPKKSQYVNNMPFCLHLWRWTKGDFPTPKTIEVGFVK